MAPAGRELTRSHGSRGSALAAHAGPETIQSTGLYDPSFEHDACGVAFIADLTGKPGHDVVSKALTALCNLEHRGAQGGDPGTGDGAGILTQIPDAFFREICDFDLPPAGSYAVGLAFLPAARSTQEEGAREEEPDLSERVRAMAVIADLAAAEGLVILGWRDVPHDVDACGQGARSVLPHLAQLFVAGQNRQRGIALSRSGLWLRKSAR